MKLEVKELRKNPGAEEKFAFSEDWRSLETAQGKVDFLTPVEFSGKVTSMDQSLLASGEISAQLELKCSRCLQSFPLPVAVGYLEEFCPAGSEEGDCRTFNGQEIDFEPSVQENIALALPMKWICAEQCKGICPQCGQDLNEADCNCVVEDIDPRMEVLKDFFK